jgi:galactokinase
VHEPLSIGIPSLTPTSDTPLTKSPAIGTVRCPARVNLRGMHIDSHGGGCNALAIPLETLLLFHPHCAGTPVPPSLSSG